MGQACMKHAAGMGPGAAFVYQEQGSSAWSLGMASLQIPSGARLSYACSVSSYLPLGSTGSFDGAKRCSRPHHHELGTLLHLSDQLGVASGKC